MKGEGVCRVVIADDHSLMRMGLSLMLANEPDFDVVGEAADGTEAVSLAQSLKPDVIVMDLMMPQMSGAEATAIIRRGMPHVHVLILTTFGTSDELRQAVANGAEGVLLKDAPADVFVAALKEVASGHQVLPKELLRQTPRTSLQTRLTARQLEVLESLTQGFSNAEIAKQFGISEICVKKHVSSIFARIGAATRTEAAAIAFKHQLFKF